MTTGHDERPASSAGDVGILSAAAELEFPYEHSTGPVIGRFLTELRDNRRIYGMRCAACAVVRVPAQDYCEACGGTLDGWCEVGPRGTLTTFALVRRRQAIHPIVGPFAYALIRLDGADTDLLHLLVSPEWSSVQAGQRVEPIWREERSGSILDIDHFEVVAPGASR